MKKLLLFSILLIATSLSSCKKEKEEDPQPTKTELLTAHEWHGVDIILYEDGTQVDSDNFDVSVLFGVNKNYFFYDENGNLDGYGKWAIIDGDPAIIRLSEEQEVSTKNQSIFRFSHSGKLRPSYTDFSIGELKESKLSLYIEFIRNGKNMKVVFNYRK